MHIKTFVLTKTHKCRLPALDLKQKSELSTPYPGLHHHDGGGNHEVQGKPQIGGLVESQPLEHFSEPRLRRRPRIGTFTGAQTSFSDRH